MSDLGHVQERVALLGPAEVGTGHVQRCVSSGTIWWDTFFCVGGGDDVVWRAVRPLPGASASSGLAGAPGAASAPAAA